MWLSLAACRSRAAAAVGVSGDRGYAGLVVAALGAAAPRERIPQQCQCRGRVVDGAVGEGEDVGATDGLAGEGVAEAVGGEGVVPPWSADADCVVADPRVDGDGWTAR